jgi:hypothetical protein
MGDGQILQWIESIKRQLFKAELRRHNEIIEELNERNSKIKQIQYIGFTHRGDFFIPKSCQHIRIKPKLPTLAFELIPEAEKFFLELDKFNLDSKQIHQILFKLLNPCMDKQDIRDALPECIVALFPKLSAIERRNEPQWSIRNNPRAIKEYQKILPKIEMYSMSRLLY